MILKLWPSNGKKIKMGMHKLLKGNRKKSLLIQIQTDKNEIPSPVSGVAEFVLIFLQVL